jgi:MoxR-like ATPase
MSITVAGRLVAEVLTPMKAEFIGKDEIIDLLGVGLVAGENVFLLGPPGTAKSALVQSLAARLQGRTFDYLLTRFTEPSELFGPFDIRRLREGDLVTNTEGMLPDASLVFLDELFNANSALLNSLLMALNERIFRRGRETRALQALMFVSASNRLPDDEALRALFDRFLLRAQSSQTAGERLTEVLEAGWRMNLTPRQPSGLSLDDLRTIPATLNSVDLSLVRQPLAELVLRMRQAGAAVTDRRAVRLQNALAASALLSGRTQAIVSDLWVLRHTWDTEDQQEILASLTTQALSRAEPDAADHPRARDNGHPDAEVLARELTAIAEAAAKPDLPPFDRAALRDRTVLIERRLLWVEQAEKREALTEMVRRLWPAVTAS